MSNCQFVHFGFNLTGCFLFICRENLRFTFLPLKDLVELLGLLDMVFDRRSVVFNYSRERFEFFDVSHGSILMSRSFFTNLALQFYFLLCVRIFSPPLFVFGIFYLKGITMQRSHLTLHVFWVFSVTMKWIWRNDIFLDIILPISTVRISRHCPSSVKGGLNQPHIPKGILVCSYLNFSSQGNFSLSSFLKVSCGNIGHIRSLNVPLNCLINQRHHHTLWCVHMLWNARVKWFIIDTHAELFILSSFRDNFEILGLWNGDTKPKSKCYLISVSISAFQCEVVRWFLNASTLFVSVSIS